MAIGYLPNSRAAHNGGKPASRVVVTRTQILSREETIRRRFLAVGLVGLLAVVTVAAYGGMKFREIARGLPSVANLSDSRNHPLTTIVSSDGVLLATFETHYRRPVALEKISSNLVDATLATEDDRFYEHSGIDARGIARAIVHNIGHRNMVGQGASTITQQLARNLYLTSQKTARRKLEEILLADRIERRYTKREILEAYLNTIYYGNGCYGAEAASQAYFHKPAAKLELGEAALLAGLPQRPAAYSPLQHPDDALARRKEVLGRMIATHKITSEEAAVAESAPVHVYRPHVQSQKDWKAPYFVAHVVSKLRENLGGEVLFSGIRVVTTLNWQMQQAAEKSLREGLKGGFGANTGALVSLDPRTGGIRALVGGADFKRDQFDAATQGIRQPGSAFKPIVYAAAFDANVCNLANKIEDKKLEYDGSPRAWVVHNYDGRYRGSMTILDGIRQSINTVAVQVADEVGTNVVQSYGQQLGITTPLTPVLPLALGASGLHPIDLCSAYSAFANHGVRLDPYSVELITDAQNAETYRDAPSGRMHPAFLNPTTVDQINVALREVVLRGTGTGAASIPDAHGKTGTTSSRRDAWFAGYTANLATVVWMAHVEKSTSGDKTIVKYKPMPGATGGQLCAPVWARYMRRASPVQARADKAHGLMTVSVQQPQTGALMAELEAVVQNTSLGESKQAEQNSVAAAPAEPISPEEPGQTEVLRTDPEGATIVISTDNRSDRIDEANQGRDMKAGYREFEQRRGETEADNP